MSALIKFGDDNASVAAFATPRQRLAQNDDPLALLAAERAQLLARIERMESDHARALEVEHTAGVAEGRALARRDESKRLELIEGAAAAASARFASRLEALDALAAAIAKAVVEQILGEALPLDAAIDAIVARQVETIGAGSVLGLIVSGDDFDAEALSALAARWPRLDVAASAGLPEGGIELTLVLGTVDASLTTQIEAAGRLLDRLAGEQDA